jgi:hypothetical protein
LKVGSNGSVYIDKKVAAAARIIASDHDHTVKACFVLGNVSSVSSTRAELEGAYRSLKHIDYLGLDPEEVNRWIDNLTGAVKSADVDEYYKHKHMLNPDANVVLAIHHIIRSVKFKDSCHHVYSHQDERERGKVKEK